jgi:hypothetical protein
MELRAGFFRYEDVDGSGVDHPDDRTFIGDPNPDFTYGLNLDIGWKNFDLTALSTAARAMIFSIITDGGLISGHHSRDRRVLTCCTNSWTPQRTDATVPKGF